MHTDAHTHRRTHKRTYICSIIMEIICGFLLIIHTHTYAAVAGIERIFIMAIHLLYMAFGGTESHSALTLAHAQLLVSRFF